MRYIILFTLFLAGPALSAVSHTVVGCPANTEIHLFLDDVEFDTAFSDANGVLEFVAAGEGEITLSLTGEPEPPVLPAAVTAPRPRRADCPPCWYATAGLTSFPDLLLMGVRW